MNSPFNLELNDNLNELSMKNSVSEKKINLHAKNLHASVQFFFFFSTHLRGVRN